MKYDFHANETEVSKEKKGAELSAPFQTNCAGRSIVSRVFPVMQLACGWDVWSYFLRGDRRACAALALDRADEHRGRHAVDGHRADYRGWRQATTDEGAGSVAAAASCYVHGAGCVKQIDPVAARLAQSCGARAGDRRNRAMGADRDHAGSDHRRGHRLF